MNTQNQNCERQNHVHELTGSTAILNECADCHNHRFCTVTGEAIAVGGNHVHEVNFRTDFSDGHYHEFCGRTCCGIDVGNGRHVHYIRETTACEDGHRHQFQAATLIESPTDIKRCD